MKWDCTSRAYARYERLTKWHRWFAWRPVRVDGVGCVWLERVERKGAFWQGGAGEGGWDWSYRALAEREG